MIIGLSGYARSGKDEAAQGLVNLGFERQAFADILREVLLATNPIVGFEAGVSVVRVRDVIAEWGWATYKESPYGKEIRELLQRQGTEGGRELLYEDIWVDATLDDYRTGKVKKLVIPDVRFPNEAEAIKEMNGYVLRLTRPGVGPANNHKSEVALDDWDFDGVLVNDGTIADLHQEAFGWAFSFALA